MAKMTRNLYEPYIDLNRGNGDPKWARVRKSTIFELSANAQEETFGFIDSPNDATEVTAYQPQLPLETVTESTDEVFRFMQNYLFEFPLGRETQVPFLLRFPIIDQETGAVDPNKVEVRIWDEAVVSNLTLNTVDQKATWTEMLNGIPRVGSMPATGEGDAMFVFTEGKPSYSPGGSTPPSTDGGSTTFSSRSSKA